MAVWRVKHKDSKLDFHSDTKSIKVKVQIMQYTTGKLSSMPRIRNSICSQAVILKNRMDPQISMRKVSHLPVRWTESKFCRSKTHGGGLRYRTSTATNSPTWTIRISNLNLKRNWLHPSAAETKACFSQNSKSSRNTLMIYQYHSI